MARAAVMLITRITAPVLRISLLLLLLNCRLVTATDLHLSTAVAVRLRVEM